MQKSKLFVLLSGLCQGDIHWLQKFLVSPFYNTNEELIYLFRYIKKYYPDLTHPKLNKEKIFQELYNGAPFDGQKMRKLMHGLALLVEEFMVAMQLRNKPFEKKKLLVESLGERNVYDLFEKGTREMIASLEASGHIDTKSSKGIHDLSFGYYSHIQTKRQNQNIDVLKKASRHLNLFYLLQNQQLEYAFKNHEKLFKDKIDTVSLKQTKAMLSDEPVFQLYEKITKIVFRPYHETDYSTIESLFKTEIEKIGKKDQLLIIRILLNHLSDQINKGEEGFQAKMLALYKFGLKRKLLIENDQISDGSFINICTVAIFEKAFDWAETFIEEYKKYLPKQIQKDATNLSLGFLYYHKKEYNKTLDYILTHTFSKPLLILQAKIILLRTYFELYLLDESYFDLVIAQTYSFEKFIRRNRLISKTKKERFINFVLFIRRIVNAHGQKELSKSIYQKIKSTESVLLKFWLLEKLKETL